MPSDDTRAPPTLRLADVLIGAAILALLVAMLLPALQRVHFRSDRSRCADNLRRLAAACHQAQAVRGSFPSYLLGAVPPASLWNGSGGSGGPGNYGTYLYGLLPFLGEDDLYRAGAVTASALDGNPAHAYEVHHAGAYRGTLWWGAGTPAAGRPVRAFVCPADPSVSADAVSRGTGWGACSYGGNFLVFGNPNPLNVNNPDGGPDNRGPPDQRTADAWGYLAKVPASFPDGTSNTVLFGEKYSECSWNGQGGGSLWGWPGTNAQWAPVLAMESPWNDGTRFQVMPTPEKCRAQYASTGHTNAMNIALADGSTRTVSRSTGALLYYAIMRPNDGMAMSEW